MRQFRRLKDLKKSDNIGKAVLMLENDRLRLEKILISEGIEPQKLQPVEDIYSSADAYAKASKNALIKYFESRKELLIAMDEYINEVKKLRRD